MTSAFLESTFLDVVCSGDKKLSQVMCFSTIHKESLPIVTVMAIHHTRGSTPTPTPP